jgi:chorismate mutase
VPHRIFALRGATTVEADTPEQIDLRTQELMQTLFARNGLVQDDLISMTFTLTRDLSSRSPATATRALGFHDVPLMGMQEAHIEGGLPKCIRVLVHVQADRARDQVRHVFLHGARVLRPDLVEDDVAGNPVDDPASPAAGDTGLAR